MTRHPLTSTPARSSIRLADVLHLLVIAACAIWTMTLILREHYARRPPSSGQAVRTDAVALTIRLDESPHQGLTD
jgi:hypothetical protein